MRYSMKRCRKTKEYGKCQFCTDEIEYYPKSRNISGTILCDPAKWDLHKTVIADYLLYLVKFIYSTFHLISFQITILLK